MISSISERRRFESIRFSHKLTVKRAEKFRKDTENEKIIEELKTDKLTGLPSFLVLKYLIKNFNNSVNDVILFGSQATGKSHEFSDYDILIILGKEYSGNDENTILDLCYEIGIKYDIIFDVHILAESEINSVRGRQAVYSKAIKSGIYA